MLTRYINSFSTESDHRRFTIDPNKLSTNIYKINESFFFDCWSSGENVVMGVMMLEPYKLAVSVGYVLTSPAGVVKCVSMFQC